MVTTVDQIEHAYDELPYVSAAFPQSSPEHLRTVAHLFGLDAPSLDQARVLELGCAAGGNIIPFAVRHPGATVVGVDVSQVQVEAGRQAILAAGLDNIQLIHRSITDVHEMLGQFDYIICHGVYSWVPDEVREAILRVSSEHLSPNGVAYVSYNVYPGWKAKEIVRDAMLLRGGPRDGAGEKLAYARGMIDFLHDMAREGSVLKKIMDENIGMIRHGEPNYLVHEFLEPCNAPCYFRDFLAAAARHELTYLGEADVPSMFPSNYSANAVEPLLREYGESQQAWEQALDFLTNRTFRQTILVRAARAGEIRYRVDDKRIRAFHVAGHFALQDGEPEHWLSERGVSVRAPSAATRRVMQGLNDAWPSTVPVAELTRWTSSSEAEVLDFVQQLIVSNGLRFRLDPVAASRTASAAPKAPDPLRRLGKLLAGTRMPLALFNLWHEPIVRMGVVEQKLLPLLDGRHSLDTLSAAVRTSAANDELSFMRNAQRIVAPAELTRAAEDHTRRALQWMAANAMLEADETSAA